MNITNDVPINLQCKTSSVFLDNNGTVSIVTAQIATFRHYCPDFVSTLSKSVFTCADLGPPQNVLISARDITNPTSTISCPVQIQDNIEPIVDCQPYTVVLDSTGKGTITATDITNSFTDNCPGTTISASTTAVNCSMLGENAILVTATDSSGNTAICKSVVTVVDQTFPTLTCNSFSAPLGSNGFVTISGSIVSTSSDNCGAPLITLSKSSFSCSDVGVNQVTVTATDAGGNQISCSASVTITDSIGASPTCQSVTLNLNQLGTATLVPSQAINQVSGGCSPLSFSAATTTFSCSTSGPASSLVTITVTDSFTVKATCQSTVSVVDTISPLLTCLPLSYSLTTSTPITFVPANGISQIVDNCPSSSVVLTASLTSLGCSNIGVSKIKITGTDAYGNMGSCVSTVTLTMNTPPTLTCPSGIVTANLSSSYPGAFVFSATSNTNSTPVCGAAVTTGDKTFGCSNTGLNNVMVITTDSYGNSASCTVKLNIVDTTKPTITCIPLSTIYINNGSASFNASSVASASDNCGATLGSNATTYTCSSIGNQTIGITATDPSGNLATCSTQLIISRPNPPVAICNPIAILALEKPSYTGTLNTSMFLQSYNDACPIVATNIFPKTNFSISDLAYGPLTINVSLVDTQPFNFSCTSNLYVIVPILDGISNFRKIHTGFVIRWDTSIPTFKGQTVSLYYFNSANNKVSINPIPLQYSSGSYNWLSGFSQVVVNKYYNLYMQVGSVLADIFPIFVVA